MWHEDVIAHSIASFQAQLATIIDHGASPQLVQACNAIQALNAAALNGDPLNQFTVAHLQPLELAERMRLVNTFSMGFGNPCGGAGRAGLMIVGTEHAYRQEDDPPRSLAVEGCALSAFWYANAGAQEAAAIAHEQTWAAAPAAFQHDPFAFYGPRRNTHTWSRAAYAVCDGVYTHWARLFRSVYMMELSAHASPVAIGGQAIPEERIQFLRHVASACGSVDPQLGRRAIGTLWFHGQGRDQTFPQAREAMIRAFFGLETAEPLEAEEIPVAGLSARTWTHGDQMAIFTRALSGPGGATNEYWQGIWALLQDRVFQAP